MKKFVFILILVILVAVGFYFINSSKNENTDNNIEVTTAEPVTPEIISELFGKKFDRPALDFVIEVIKSDGTFGQGSINIKNEPGGGMWFAAKTANGWELAFDGNGMITCDVVDKYSFPRDIVTQCIDTQNENKLIER